MSDTINQEINVLAAALADVLLDKNMTLAVAESCTGGWLSKVLTDPAGSSRWYLGGVVSYSNSAKEALLNVDEHCIEGFGAVSEQVAQAMAVGARQVFSSSISVSITGIAGPSGGTTEKPVGLVWFGVCRSEDQCLSTSKVFEGCREQVRQQAVKKALQLLIEGVAD